MFARPHVLTERLDLRLPEAGDGQTIYEIIGDPETHRFLGPRESFTDHFSRFMRGAGSWLIYGYGFFMVRQRGSEEVIGNCGIFHSRRGLGEDMDDGPEAGWILSADHTGKGYAREAMVAILDWFDRTRGSRRVTAMIEPGNHASFALAARRGFEEFRRTEKDGCEVVLLERVPG